jgi:hypothetical protein
MRDEAVVSFWIPSPELKPRSPSPTADNGRKSKRSRRSARYSDESSDNSDSEDGRHRRRKSKKSSSHKKKSSSKHKKSSRRRHRRSVTPSSESESEEDLRSAEPTSNGKRNVLEVDESQLDAVPDLWVEKQGMYNGVSRCRYYGND